MADEPVMVYLLFEDVPEPDGGSYLLGVYSTPAKRQAARAEFETATGLRKLAHDAILRECETYIDFGVPESGHHHQSGGERGQREL